MFAEDHFASWHMDNANFLAGRFSDAFCGDRHSKGTVAEEILLGMGNWQQTAGDRMVAFDAIFGGGHGDLSFYVCLFDSSILARRRRTVGSELNDVQCSTGWYVWMSAVAVGADPLRL